MKRQTQQLLAFVKGTDIQITNWCKSFTHNSVMGKINGSDCQLPFSVVEYRDPPEPKREAAYAYGDGSGILLRHQDGSWWTVTFTHHPGMVTVYKSIKGFDDYPNLKLLWQRDAKWD